MNWFWLIFLGLYGSVHAALWLRLRVLLPAGRPWGLALAGFLALMVLLPPAARMLERAGRDDLALVLAWMGFVWMGLAMLFFMTGLLSWLVQGLGALAGRLGWWSPPAGWSRQAALAALILAGLATAYGVIEARTLRVERVTIASPKIARPVVIAQVSDVHLGLLAGQRRLKHIVRLIKAEQPDLVVSTGDLVDGNLFENDGLAGLWAELDPPLGKFAVVGNHEVYAGLGQALDFHRRAGFEVLRGQMRDLGSLAVAGLDDPAVGQMGLAPAGAGEAELLAQAPAGRFVLLLKHRPTADPASLGRFDLQLSGHTHRGQIWPFSFITGAIYPMQDGLHQPGQGSRVYTNRGTGTWGPPLRIAAPPEISLIRLVPQP
ncbi:MAG: metallophosphoesterase [Thermodesulfobacteriota bacterium]